MEASLKGVWKTHTLSHDDTMNGLEIRTGALRTQGTQMTSVTIMQFPELPRLSSGCLNPELSSDLSFYSGYDLHSGLCPSKLLCVRLYSVDAHPLGFLQ
jgi:hypothetical protein